MDFKCEACSKVTSVPDEKVPVGKAFSFGCPQCGEKIYVTAEQTKPEEKHGPVKDALAASPDDDEIEYFTPEDKVALICDKKNFATFEKIFTDLGYKISQPKGIIDSLKKMKFYTYDIVVLNQEFDHNPEEGYTVYDYIAPMPMGTRRKMFVIRVGNGYRSNDNMRALSESMNLVYNEKELDTFPEVFQRALADHERFYQIFIEALKDRGKY